MSRFIVADPFVGKGWSHYFDHRSETLVRWVYDVELGRIAHLDLHVDGRWKSANEAERADLEDSVKTANSEALDSPDEWGLVQSDDAPEWAPGCEAPPSPRR